MLSLGAAMGWDDRLVALQALSSLLIAVAFVLAAAALFRLFRKGSTSLRHQSSLLTMLFAALVAGGLVQFGGLMVVWTPAYGLYVLAELVFGATAVAAAIIVWRAAPRLIALPSRAELEDANSQLGAEVDKRRALVLELQEVNAELERRVRERTRELNEAKDRFEVALAGSRIAVATQDRDLVYRWIHNPPFGLEAGAVIGATDESFLPTDAAAQLRAVKSGVMQTGKSADTEIEVLDPLRGRTWLRVHAAPQCDADDTVTGVVSVLVDVTEERRRADMLEQVTQALAEANARFDTALGGSNITMDRQDRALRYTWIHNPPVGLEAESFLGRDDDEALPDLTSRVVVPAKRQVLETGEPHRLELSQRIGDALRWFDLRIEPLVERGDVVGLMCVAIDITDQKEHQQQLKFVMRELTHRSKNLLAVVQGIARQTAQTVDDLPAFVDRFGARLQALARAHDILVDESWRGASLDELVSSQLGHVIEKTDERLVEKGGRVMLKPEAAQNVALALHELATNAAKYGALSTPQGHVAVQWGLADPDGEDDRPIFQITWCEQGGPPVQEPKRKGFGRMMIERLVPRAIDGTSELVFEPGGIRWTLRFPTDYLADSDELRQRRPS